MSVLGLPSTTEVNKRIPKEAFYHNLKMNAALRSVFTNDIEKITVRNTLKPSTINIPPGKRVSEILVLEVSLKRRCVPTEALSAIAAQNPHKLVFVCTFEDECALAIKLTNLVVGAWQSIEAAKVTLRVQDIDVLWDSIASSVAYGDAGSERETVEKRFANDAKLLAMKTELAKLNVRRKKEKQFAKKNALFEQAKKLEAQIAAFEKGR